MNIKSTSYDTVAQQASSVASLVAAAVAAYDAAGEEITPEVLSAAAVNKLSQGQRTGLKNYWELDYFVRHQAERGFRRLQRGISVEKIKSTLTGHQNKMVKNDGYNSLMVMSPALVDFLQENLNKDNPFRPQGEKGNGNRPYHQDHMIFGLYVCEKIPMLLIDGTWTEEQAATAGEGIRFLLNCFVVQFITRDENDRLDTPGEDGQNLRSAFPIDREGQLTSRSEARNIPLCCFDLGVMRKYGWTPFSGINEMEAVTIKMLRGEPDLCAVILT